MWLNDHVDSCDANYEGSSGGMEAAAAVEMWGRSLNYNMQYETFVSDGDSSAFLAVCAMNEGKGPYGDECKVQKIECVNHVAKRLGTGLRGLKKVKNVGKQKRSSIGGKNKLTDVVIDHLQHYFQVSLNRKIGTSAKEMREEIMSTFYHCTSTDMNPQHQLCAKGEHSWCFYNRSMARGETPQSHTKMKVFFHLDDEQKEQVKAIYDRLTTDDMMNKCLKGVTQNRNEHLHSRVWKLCSKHLCATKRMVHFATATAATNYNVGYVASHLGERLGIEWTTSMMTHLTAKDKRMDLPHKRRMRNKKLRDRLQEYASGGF